MFTLLAVLLTAKFVFKHKFKIILKFVNVSVKTSQCGLNGRRDKPPPPSVRDKRTNKPTGKQKHIAISFAAGVL